MRVETTEEGLRETAAGGAVREIVEGILTLAAVEKACLPLARIHSILHEMKSSEPILAELYFSLTGDICYSDDVDKAIQDLVAWGSLEIVDRSAVIVEGFHRFRKHLLNTLTKRQSQVIHAASRCFFDRANRTAVSPSRSPRGYFPGSDRRHAI